MINTKGNGAKRTMHKTKQKGQLKANKDEGKGQRQRAKDKDEQ